MKTIGYLLVSLFLLCSCVQEQSKVVSLTSGQAQGVYADSIYSFKGIPYAKAARFMPPEQPDIWDTVRIFNLHLQSLRFSDEDLEYLEEPSINNDSSFKKSKNIISKFKTGFAKRRIQSIHVKEEMNKSPYPLVVCGDFNDVPNSFAYHHIGKGLINAFAESGTGSGRTYSHIAPTLRIDNIFADTRFTIHQFARVGKRISDHFPIIVDLELK